MPDFTPRSNDPAWLTEQYDNRARVPEYPQHLARWQQASRRARDSLQGRLDIHHGPAPGEALDLFVPKAPSPSSAAPVLVFVHGGYWRALDKADFSFVAEPFVKAGAAVVVPNYDLCPKVTMETLVLQVCGAVAWVHREGPALGLDAAKVVVAGHSAGGHLAAMMLSCRWPVFDASLPANLVADAIAISGMYDLEPIRCTPFLQADLRLAPATVKRASPAFYPRPRGRLWAVDGALESQEYHRHLQLIRDQWGPTAVPLAERIEGRDHFTVLDAFVEPAHRLHRLALERLGLARGD